MEPAPAPTSTPRPQVAGGSWLSFAVRPAGGAGRLDDVLRHAIEPVITERAPERWSFVRWIDGRGPHVRVALWDEAWSSGDADALREQLTRSIRELPDSPDPQRLLPLPASQRRAAERAGVEPVELRAGEEPDDALHQVSSEVVLAAITELPFRGRERFAYAMTLMRALADRAVAPDALAEFWEDVARRWTGTGEPGRRVLAHLAERVDDLADELHSLASSVRADNALAAGLERYESSCGECGAEEARRHAHLTNNRLGITPLEEALLACVLAKVTARGGDDVTAGGDATTSDDATEDAGSQPGGREVVVLRQVSKAGEEGPILDDISLTVHEGEVLGILGPGAAGKSSLLGIAAGLRVASRGDVRVLGDAPRVERGALAIPLPEDELSPNATARENLELHVDDPGADVDAALRSTGLHDRAATPAGDLDLGERRRLAIAAALLEDPAVLLLDEPTAGLSAIEREGIWRVVADRRARGATTILATTSLQETLSTCDRAALVVGGTLVTTGSPQQIADDHFPERSLHFRVIEEPAPELIADLPEVGAVRMEPRPDHVAIEVRTRQPDELLKLLGADVEFPEIVTVAAEDLEGTFLRSFDPSPAEPAAASA
jgi:ABC-2 type transport system ATP-binding protein